MFVDQVGDDGLDSAMVDAFTDRPDQQWFEAILIRGVDIVIRRGGRAQRVGTGQAGGDQGFLLAHA